jgi:hypothetical protein
MIFCEAGGTDAAAIDKLAVFVSQLRAHDIPAIVPASLLPHDISAAHQFDLAAFLSDAVPTEDDHLLLLDVDKIDAERANRLRGFAKGKPMPQHWLWSL